MNEKLPLQFLESHLSEDKRLRLNRVFLKYKSSSILKMLSLGNPCVYKRYYFVFHFNNNETQMFKVSYKNKQYYKELVNEINTYLFEINTNSGKK